MQLVLINKNNEELDLLNNTDKFVLTQCEALHGLDLRRALVAALGQGRVSPRSHHRPCPRKVAFISGI